MLSVDLYTCVFLGEAIVLFDSAPEGSDRAARTWVGAELRLVLLPLPLLSPGEGM